jgi:hypothetical protein
MRLDKETVTFLSTLRKNKPLRDQIAARPDRTMLYAGGFFRPVWKELEALRLAHSAVHDWELLPDVLRKLPRPSGASATSKSLLDHVEDLSRRVPWKPDGFTIWRALSGIFASNAVGRVRFYIGSGVTREEKVFAATEVGVLRRNPNIDPVTREVVEYLADCVQRGQAAINFALT